MVATQSTTQNAAPAPQMVQKKKPLFGTKDFLCLFLMALGSLIVTVGYLIFLSSNGLISGGVWGIAAIINYFLPKVPLGIMLVLLNAPILLWGWKKLDMKFTIMTVFVILLESVLLIVCEPFLPVYTNNVLLACLFGGILVGAGSGIIVRYRGSSGGVETVCIILRKKYDLSIGSMSLIINAILVLLAAFIFGFERAMYTLVNLYATSLAFTRVLEGGNQKRNMMIVSEKGEELAEHLMRDLGRGVTMMKGVGGYTHTEKSVLFCVVSRYELMRLKDIIRSIDPHAFVAINETYEVMGRFTKSRKTLVDDEDTM